MTHYYRHLMHTPRSVTHVLDRPLQYEQSLLPPKAPAPKEGEADEDAPPPIAYFIVLVDTGKGILTLQATLAMPAAKETREAALAIIQSFKRED